MLRRCQHSCVMLTNLPEGVCEESCELINSGPLKLFKTRWLILHLVIGNPFSHELGQEISNHVHVIIHKHAVILLRYKNLTWQS